MDDPVGWSRPMGAEVYKKLVNHIETNPAQTSFRISMKGVRRLEFSFASESIVELMRRYRGAKSICLTDLSDPTMIENIDAAAARVGQPVTVWNGKSVQVLGPKPSTGNRDAFAFALARASTRAAEFADKVPGMTIANASAKFKQLWEQGYLMRSESAADSGGVEFLYERIA